MAFVPHTMTDEKRAEPQARLVKVSGNPDGAAGAGDFTPRQPWRSVPCVGNGTAEMTSRGHLPMVWRADAGHAERRRKRLLANV